MMGFLLMSAILLILVGGLYIVSFLLSVTNRSISKLSAYECGFDSFGDARVKFDLLYYLIGILYLIFDLELIFLFPMATILFSLGSLVAFWTAMVFLTLLTIGFIYEWFQGALEIVDQLYKWLMSHSGASHSTCILLSLLYLSWVLSRLPIVSAEYKEDLS